MSTIKISTPIPSFPLIGGRGKTIAAIGRLMVLLAPFTQNNVLQHIYFVGKTLAVLMVRPVSPGFAVGNLIRKNYGDI